MDRYKWTLDYVESLPFEDIYFWAEVVEHVMKEEQKAESEKHSSWAKFFVNLFKAAWGKN
jgi:hypothetical protein